MGVSAGAGDDDVMAEINITPFTDVLLVLLIIFMIAATAVVQHGFNINLPKATKTTQIDDNNIIVAIDTAGGITVNNKAVAEADLVSFPKRMKSEKHDTNAV